MKGEQAKIYSLANLWQIPLRAGEVDDATGDVGARLGNYADAFDYPERAAVRVIGKMEQLKPR